MTNSGGDESWREGSLIDRHRHLLKTGFMYDCTFLVGVQGSQTQFQCHKLMLGHSSKVFYLMLYLNMPEADEIRIEDIQPQHFRKILEYIYTDQVDLEDVEMAFCVCKAADDYRIKPLTLKCLEFLSTHLSAANVCRFLEFSPAKHSKKAIANCMEYLNHYTEAVLASEGFLRLKRDTLTTIVKQPNLRITSEVHLFSACLRWAESNVRPGESLRETLGSALSHIRFLTFSTDEFTTFVTPTKILTPLEERDIHCCIATHTGDMPIGICDIDTLREIYDDTEILTIYDFTNHKSDGSIATSGESDYWKIYFSCDSDASIAGIQIWGARSDLNIPYNEYVKAVLKKGSNIIAVGMYRGKQSFGAIIDLNFKSPGRIIAGCLYSLQLYYADPNQVYMSYELLSSEIIAKSGLNLHVSGSSFNHITNILIAKRIFVD